MTCDEAQELITGLIDGELRDLESGSLTTHLEECSRCRLALQTERDLKRAIQASAAHVRAPRSLRDRILLDRSNSLEKRRTRWQDYLWPMPRLAPVALALAFILTVGLSMFLLYKPESEPIASAALQTYRLFARGELAVHRAENPTEIVDQLSRAVGGHFHPMGYDLTAIHLRPVAGTAWEIQGRHILIAIYQGQGGTLFCYTFFGSEKDAPADAARFFDPVKKMNFYAFSQAGLNAVLHREGEMICVLASEMPMDDLLALARSKARPS